MIVVKKIKTSVWIIFTVMSGLFLFTKCISNDSAEEEEKPAVSITNAKGSAFASSQICANCHKDIYDSHLHTAHYLTSQPGNASYIKGNFDSGKNVFRYSDSVKVVMEKEGNNYYQVQYVNGKQKRKESFDIVIGSGTKGQTYLYWNAKKILQLPVFYYTDYHEWANSPGYPGKVIYNRPITSRCLECHSTYAQKISDEKQEPEDFDRDKIIFGVDCEKCHGPSAQHAAFQLENPKDTTGKFVINPGKLSRVQQLDLCALCHGGRLMKTKPSFTFQAGDALTDFFQTDTTVKDAGDIDVHGNQLGLLSASKCFKMSEMTCSTCHNPHENEAGKIETFSSRCMNCHNETHNSFCKLGKTIGVVIAQNCIDCHMPVQASKAIVFLRQGETKPSKAFMRSHYIKIYPDETKKMLEYIKAKTSRQASSGK